jgi:hypothetical protein
MSYCRFTNTLGDLRDCYDTMDEVPESEEEQAARRRLLVMCRQIADDYEDEIEEITAARAARRGASRG